ncbi:hypothetical protein BVC80_1835g582 [Macleaya cordata]|uniref:Uncharacterized protein n=1 Tax=Macleaya cordata TaxID=56857 RepID=A0A200R600_MACCD|nr:hypothetical protein BVC80_1835g582 [Macleaya cordata]
MNLGHDPIQCLHVIAFWKWLEAEFGYQNIIFTLLRVQSNRVVFTTANKTVDCINCFQYETPPPRSSYLTITTTEFRRTQGWISLPALHRFRRISLRSLHRYKESALTQISETVNDAVFVGAAVQLAALINLLGPNRQPRAAAAVGEAPAQVRQCMIDPNLNRIINRVPLAENRTMMITFSRANPITERELRYFFDRYYGRNGIERVYMEVENRPVRPSCWYVLVVFRPAETATAMIFLHGQEGLVEFVINGKHATGLLLPFPG